MHPLQGTLSSELDRVPTTDFDPKAYRLTFQPKTVKTWNDYQNDGITWAQFQASSFRYGLEKFITDEQSYETEAIDIGVSVTAVFIVDFQSYSTTNLGVIIIDISTSTDGISYSAYVPFVAGQYTARYVKFRFRIQATLDSTVVRLISAYLTVDVPDRNQSILNQTIGAGGSTVNFSGFTSVKSIVVTTVGTSNLTPRIDDQSNLPNSALIKLFDTSGNLQSGSVNIAVNGY